MGTKNCKHCGALMDGKESACPACGKKMWSKRILLLIIFVGWVLLTIIGSVERTVRPEHDAENIHPVVNSRSNVFLENADPDLTDESGQVTLYVKASVLNVRDTPSPSGKVVGQKHVGDSVLLYEQSRVLGENIQTLRRLRQVPMGFNSIPYKAGSDC